MIATNTVSGRTRRQFIITAMAYGAAGCTSALGMTEQSSKMVIWRGAVLGGEATIKLYHSDPVWAKQQLDRCQQEIDRLENLFSLYRPYSAVRQLNRDGFLEKPDIDFVELLSLSKAFYLKSHGVFDVSMQPLWTLFAEHFSNSASSQDGPSSSLISETLIKVGSENIAVSPRRVSFLRDGMAITFNGIAQGYITDKVTRILRAAGFENVLVSLGEQYALGRKSSNKKWRVGILSPADQRSTVKTVELENAAIATSGGYGSPFSMTSPLNHLIDPRSGSSADPGKSVSVISTRAVKADMYSTALSLMSPAKGKALASKDPEILDVFYF